MADTYLRSRRAALRVTSNDLAQIQHPGLWLERGLLAQRLEGGVPPFTPADALVEAPKKGEKTFKARLVAQAAACEVPGYADFFRLWQQSLREVGARPYQAVTRGRLVVGLGGEAALETALTVHRTYGVPYLPGSALKGLASSFAHQRSDSAVWRKATEEAFQGEAHALMFGNTEQEGCVRFYDALPLPDQWQIHPDIITVHHPAYYSGGGEPPADWDDPTPVSFASVSGSFLVALGGPQDWVSRAGEILGAALDQAGIGAKTSSGYGRMTLSN